jgi:hypothetical protein
MHKSFSAMCGIVLMFAGQASADMIFVDMLPSQEQVDINETFEVTIQADITRELLGFGFDMMYDENVVQVENVSFPDTVLPLPTRDGDGLAAVGFNNNRLGELIGDDITLATVTFRGITAGVSAISMDYTISDPSEGFPEKGDSFATLNINPGLVRVGPAPQEVPIPEPSIFVMFLIPAIGIILWKTFMRPDQR